MTDGSGIEDELAVQDRVLVEAEILGRSVSFRAVIVKISPAELWLGLASPDRRLETMRPNQTVKLTVARTNAALLGQSGFLRPLGGSKSRVFAVVRPGVLERVQRRAHVRYQMDLPIYFRHLDPKTREPRGKAVSGLTVNVSPGGLLFESDAHVELGDELDVTLPLTGSDRISTVGLVTRVRGADDGDSSPNVEPERTEVAVRFTRITAVDQDRIVRFILLSEHRRREAAARQPQAPVVAPTPVTPQVASGLTTPTVPRAVATPPPRPATVATPPPAPEAIAPPPPVPSAVPAPAAPRLVAPPKLDPDEPLVAVGLQMCEGSGREGVRLWFDSLMPGSRIELLCQLQANMAGTSVPGAQEPGSVRPLAIALGLLAA